MNEISLIYNTGIQFYELLEDLLIDLNSNVVKAQRFYEFKFKDKEIGRASCRERVF